MDADCLVAAEVESSEVYRNSRKVSEISIRK